MQSCFGEAGSSSGFSGASLSSAVGPKCRFICALILIIALPISALLAGTAGWFLAQKEPGASENVFWTIVRMLLRVTGTATGVAIPMLVLGLVTDSPPIAVADGFCTLAIPVYAMLTMLYIFRMARRIPNNSLATCAMVIAVGLPTTLGMIVFAVITMVIGAKTGSKPTADSIGLITAGTAYWMMYAFTWFYIAVLFWFKRCFS